MSQRLVNKLSADGNSYTAVVQRDADLKETDLESVSFSPTLRPVADIRQSTFSGRLPYIRDLIREVKQGALTEEDVLFAKAAAKSRS